MLSSPIVGAKGCSTLKVKGTQEGRGECRGGCVHLIRHGRTSGNGQIHVGRLDLPLDQVGKSQASALAGRMQTHKLDEIWCSPLQRATSTARPLVEALRIDYPETPEPRLMDELQEIDYGSLQGSDKHQVKLSLRRQHMETALPGGESLADVRRRVLPVASALLDAATQGRRTAVVAHFWSLRLLRGCLLGVGLEETLSRKDYKPGNADWRSMYLTRQGWQEVDHCTGEFAHAPAATSTPARSCGGESKP